MPDSELRLWEAALDPVRLDLCGCRRGAAAAALAAPAGAALVLTGTCPLPWAAGLWAGVVLAVKLATQAGAMRERGRMHARLEVRIEQLDRRQQPA